MSSNLEKANRARLTHCERCGCATLRVQLQIWSPSRGAHSRVAPVHLCGSCAELRAVERGSPERCGGCGSDDLLPIWMAAGAGRPEVAAAYCRSCGNFVAALRDLPPLRRKTRCRSKTVTTARAAIAKATDENPA